MTKTISLNNQLIKVRQENEDLRNTIKDMENAQVKAAKKRQDLQGEIEELASEVKYSKNKLHDSYNHNEPLIFTNLLGNGLGGLFNSPS